MAEAWAAAAGIIVTAVCAVMIELIRSKRREDSAAEKVQQTVDYEFSPNNGHSARDAINRIESTVGDIKTTVGEQGQRLARLEGAFGEHVKNRPVQ